MRLRAALKRAVRDAIRQYCGFAEGECDITPPPGKPHPRAGRWFVAVWDGPRSWEHSASLMMRLSVNITVSLSVGNTPTDRLGTKAIDQASDPQDGLNERVGQIATMLYSQQWSIAQQADNLMSAGPGNSGIVNGILEAGRPLSDTGPEERPHSWWNSLQPQATTVPAAAGYACTLTYGGVLVAQHIEEGTG